MDTKEHLDYVIRLQEREISNANSNGVTRWALVVAVLYLFLLSFPILVKIKYSELPIEQSLILFTHTLGFILGLTWFYDELKGKPAFNKFDYRFKKKSFTIIDLMVIKFGFELTFLLTSLICILSANVGMEGTWSELAKFFGIENKLNVSTSEYLFLYINLSFPGLIMFAVIVLSLKDYWKTADTKDYPDWFDVDTNNSADKNYVTRLFIAAMIFGNIYWVINPTNAMAKNDYQELVSLSFYLSLSIYGICYFLKSFNKSSRLGSLNKIERDIVLHNLDDKEIRRALEDVYFGSEFHNWLDEKIKVLKSNVEKALLIASQHSILIGELDKLPKDHTFEKNGRIDKFTNELESTLNEATKEIEKLKSCLGNLKRHEKHDKNFLATVTNQLDEITKLEERIKGEPPTVLKKLKQLKTV